MDYGSAQLRDALMDYGLGHAMAQPRDAHTYDCKMAPLKVIQMDCRSGHEIVQLKECRMKQLKVPWMAYRSGHTSDRKLAQL